MNSRGVGILGGGQLARMMALAAHPLGVSPAVYATHGDDPAAQVSSAVRLGSLSDRESLRKFLAETPVVTFESEFVDTELLKTCLPASTFVFPSLPVLAAIQDRVTQKRLLDRFKIPTSPWTEVNSAAELRRAVERFPRGFVLKQRRFGYDGYGTFVFRRSEDADPAVLQKSKFGFIAEEFVPFKRELAVSFARSATASVELPLVESVQENSRCLSVRGPFTHPGLAALRRLFRRLMSEEDYVGLLAVELFEIKGGLLVNELAPRVHNSAHYTQAALTCSQFEYHLRAGLGLPLPKVELLRPAFAMVNLLGEGGAEVRLSRAPVGQLHWYGKSDNRAGRKLGHLNVLDQTPAAALRRALKWRKDFRL